MKDLEKIKKGLPPGIDIRPTAKNQVRFRARFRKGGQEVVKTFPDLKLAKQWLAEKERSALLGEFLPQAVKAQKRTFSDALARYRREELPKKGNDARNREYHLKWFENHLGQLQFASIRSSHIKESILELEKMKARTRKKLAPATIVRYLASLSHLFSIAMREWEWINENPLNKISKPSVSNIKQRYLSHPEKKRLLEEAKKSKCSILHLMIVLSLSTGMRAGEVKKLKRKDIILEQGLIILETSKNGEPRIIPVKGYTHRILSLYLNSKNFEFNVLIFASPNDEMKPYDIRTAWLAALRRANITNFRWHDLRHTTASYLRMNGKSLHDIGAVLGHIDQRSSNRYSHISTEYKSNMVEELDQTLFGDLNDE